MNCFSLQASFAEGQHCLFWVRSQSSGLSVCMYTCLREARRRGSCSQIIHTPDVQKSAKVTPLSSKSSLDEDVLSYICIVPHPTMQFYIPSVFEICFDFIASKFALTHQSVVTKQDRRCSLSPFASCTCNNIPNPILSDDSGTICLCRLDASNI